MIDNVTRFKAIIHYTHYLQSLRKVASIYNISKSSLHNSFKSCKTLRRVKLTLLMAVSATGIVHYEILDHNCKKADFHHSIETVQAAKTKGFSLIHIPPYSPKMNAIENVFGMLNARYRRRCPLIASKTTDYKDLLVQTLDATQQFSAFFSEHSCNRSRYVATSDRGSRRLSLLWLRKQRRKTTQKHIRLRRTYFNSRCPGSERSRMRIRNVKTRQRFSRPQSLQHTVTTRKDLAMRMQKRTPTSSLRP